MPTKTEIKSKELKWFLAFQENYPQCPRSAPIQPDPPAPDIVFPECGLGIEITRYLLGQGKDGSRPWQLETAHQRITSAAQIEYEASMKHSLQVSVLWTIFTECPTTHEERGIAQAIARLVATNITTRQGTGFVNWGTSNNSLLQKYGVEVNIYPIDGQVPSCWKSVVCFSFPKEATRIQVAMDEKKSKVATYRKYCQILWLLVIADKSFLSSSFSPHPNLSQTKFKASFDRVFLLEEPQNFICEFKIDSSNGVNPQH
jgi:hypothetical protein